ncbi:DNA polymerase delta subunit 3-like [Rhopalosiphum maidis]|uniref:DNA polymerase delta subunit 3-like n=1 Tax=Rhopalosiphum maidis TaxID=43146 RepID=UPI000F0022BB|nr:DNA polymerase delta subunit 3-like [Rhopalosiphum maidis]
METKIIVEQLEDKQQIVTYKYLIEKLNIHPNKAKQLLKDYVSKLTDDQKYSITVVIGGTLKENDEFCIVLAYDDHVETMRRRFKQIDFEHIYSIQPISRFDDINNALYLVNNSLNNYTNLLSSIKTKEKRNDLMSEQKDAIEMEINLPLTKQTNLSPNKIQNHKSETIARTELDKPQKKKNGLDFFKNNSTNNTKQEEIEKKVIPNKANSDFFTKFKNSNKNPCITNGSTDSKNKVTAEKITKVDTKIIDLEPPKNVQDNSTSVCKEKNLKKEKKKKENVNKSKSNQKVKRKRIQTFDSSDEEIDSEEEDMKRSEHVMDGEDDVDFVQPTPPRPTPRENRKKEKQITTSTFIDDDGFVHTTKEVKIVETECESLSESTENDNIPEPKELNIEPVVKKIKICESDSADKKKNKNKKSKNSSNQGMKQSSLTSFFKTK